MKVYDKHGEYSEPQKQMRCFGSLKNGALFLQGGRVLMKMERGTFRIIYSGEDGHQPVLEEVNAVRIAALESASHLHGQTAGRWSKFSDETSVEVLCKAALYLKG